MAVSSSFGTDEIIHLNVGGTRFSTSKQTLTWVPDSFFTGLLSNGIASYKDEQGAIFIDRDPSLFSIVLNYLRTKHVNISNIDIHSLKHEAEYYGITPLVKRLMLCEDLSHSTCGDILFIGYLKPPNEPSQESCSTSETTTDIPAEVSPNVDPVNVRIIRADQNYIVVAYAHFVTCYEYDQAIGLKHTFTSPHVDATIERVAISTKYSNSADIDIAFSYGSQVRLWSLYKDGPVDVFDLNARVEYLFFIGNQLVALSSTGAIGVRHAMTHHWQRQNVVPTLSFETAGSLLLLGCNNGSIYYIDMEKFPLRMKDNDLLVTELYRDPNREPITAISVYLTPETSACGIWIEFAYGTKSGTVRIVTQHPETGVSMLYAPRLFHSFTAHQSSVSKVSLSNKYLVSVCSDYNHVRSWTMTRCAGMLSLYPGPSPNASFKLVSLEGIESCVSYNAGNDYGPYGEQDDEQVFIQKVVPETDQLHVRLASNGKRVCVIKSVNNSVISSFFVHKLQNPEARSMRVIFTGHSNGTVQIWDLTTALQSWYSATRGVRGGPTPEELWRFLDQCDLSNSHCSTPCISPSPSLAPTMPVSYPSNILVLSQSQTSEPTSRPSQT